MTYQLICEGACNPNLAFVDAVLLEDKLNGEERGTEATHRLQRTLKHTTHSTATEGDIAACIECGAVRGYGRTLVPWVKDEK